MKHTLNVTLLLITLFLMSQFVGLSLLNKDLNVSSVVINNETVNVANYSETAVGERPDMSPGMTFWYIVFAIGFGTLLVLLLVKFKKPTVWRVWFLLAVMFTIAVSLGVLVKFWIAYVLAFGLALWKVYKPNVYVHNLTEVLMYSGIALIFVPILNVFWTFILLLAISVYDIYAVWKSKHMVDMAKFQTNSGVFAGLNISYTAKKSVSKEVKPAKSKIPSPPHMFKKNIEERKNAILGGGDIAFPMLFSGVVMQTLIVNVGLTKHLAYLEANIITLFVALALGLLFVYAKKDRFYPAMPFVTAGAIIGFIIVLILNPSLLGFSLLF